jgi:hypothetical protein
MRMRLLFYHPRNASSWLNPTRKADCSPWILAGTPVEMATRFGASLAASRAAQIRCGMGHGSQPQCGTFFAKKNMGKPIFRPGLDGP